MCNPWIHLTFYLGIPVDLLVDIDGPQDRFTNSTCFKNFDNDDPFELCSFPNRTEKDLGAELGFVLEKSIRISSQSNCHISTSGISLLCYSFIKNILYRTKLYFGF